MKTLLTLLILSTALFSDNSSIERPNMFFSKDADTEILENIEVRLSNIHDELAMLKALVIEAQKGNQILSVLNENLLYSITEQQKTTQTIEYLAWQNDHKTSESKPPKKGP